MFLWEMLFNFIFISGEGKFNFYNGKHSISKLESCHVIKSHYPKKTYILKNMSSERTTKIIIHHLRFQ